ncbi:ribosome recycling factor [Candidatus Gracilibacteria bacterium]|nr:ribosome recycling factor [Candidatus Gracilibacteria bacterium]
MLANLQQELHKATNHMQNELSKLQAGRANSAIVEDIYVMAYGSLGPLKNIAAVSVMDASTIVIQPWDKTLIRDIEKGISEAKIGLNPSNNGETLMIKIPPLTEERRRDLVKIASRLGEEGKVGIRNIRQEFKKKIDKSKADKEISEDEAKTHEANLQKEIDKGIKQIEEMLKVKEIEIMKV